MIKTFFTLKSEPFTKEMDTKDVFMFSSFKELMSRLDYMKKHLGLMLVTAEPGTGKTLAIRTFVESLNTNLYYPVYIPLSTISEIELYRQLNIKLTGERLHRKVDLFNSIQNAVKDYVTNKKKVPVIIIDEAHLLRGENLYEIQIILNFDIDSTNPVLFIMVGQSHLRDKISRPVYDSLNQRFCLKYHITPMNKQETTDYIKHRLSICGAKENIFSESAIESIFQKTAGIPRYIDNIATKALTIGCINKKHTITEEEIFSASKEL